MIAAFVVLFAVAWGQQPVEPGSEVPPPEAPPAEAPPAEPPAEVVPAEPDLVESSSAEAPAQPLPEEEWTLAESPLAGALPEPAPLSEIPHYEPDPAKIPPRKFGLNVEFGWLTNREPAHDVFSRIDGMPSFGVGTNFRLARYLVVVGAWHHVRQGADVYVSGTDTDTDFQNDQRTFRAALLAHQATLGARLDAPIVDTFFPFLSAQGQLVRSWARFDDVLDDRRNPTQVQARGLHMGGLFTGGVELRLPPDERVQTSLTVEMGYAWLSRSELGQFGEMKPGGFASRLGWGIRF